MTEIMHLQAHQHNIYTKHQMLQQSVHTAIGTRECTTASWHN